jgi:hypothetical protein
MPRDASSTGLASKKLIKLLQTAFPIEEMKNLI